MSVYAAFTIPFADFFILGAIAFFAFSGFMRGALRTLFSALRIYFSFIITTIFYERVALLIQVMFDTPSWVAQMICFIIVFGIILFIIWLVGAILSKRISKPQTSSGLDKVGGAILGLVEGVLIVSIIIMFIDFYPTPKARSPLEDAISYKAIKNIAPGIKDLTMRPISRIKHTDKKSKSDDIEEWPR